MSNGLKNPIVWIDCEMTGLDLTVDELVEVSVVITDYDLTPVDEGIDLLIKPTPAAVEHMGDFVREMHTHSGLINEWDSRARAGRSRGTGSRLYQEVHP